MSGDGKGFDYLNPLDQRLKRLFPSGMRSGVDVEIRCICGFERFNTRPYHNYETWSTGYEAWKDGKRICEAEDLDVLVDRIAVWAEKQQELDKLT